MDNLVLFSVITGIVTIIGFFLQVYDKIPEKIARKLYYILTNKRFEINITTVRKYSEFELNMHDLKMNIQNRFKELGLGFDFEKYGLNYIEILPKGAQAPFLIKIMPESDPHDPDERVVVSIRLLGTIIFRYNDDLDNRNYLSEIEELFKVIESTHKIHADYENYNLISTKSGHIGFETFNKKIEKDNSVINLGENSLNIHSRSLTKLYDVYKKNISAI